MHLVAHKRSFAPFGILNDQYPASYWIIAFGKDVRPGEVVPIRRLERELLLWRDHDGTLYCQDHACARRIGRLGADWQKVDGGVVCPAHRNKFQLCQRYLVIERYRTIFLWNGGTPPDHPLPDLLGPMGLRDEDIHFVPGRVFFPCRGKWFAENLPDGAHFAILHNTGDAGDAEVISETDTALSYRLSIDGQRPLSISLRRVVELYRSNSLSDYFEVSGDIDVTTYGSGLHSFLIAPAENVEQRKLSPIKRAGKFVESTLLITSLTPVTAGSHITFTLAFVRKIPVPILGNVLEGLLGASINARNWTGIRQDVAVLTHRREPQRPGYNRFDRALVRFRRLWQRRLLDQEVGGE